jgi:hypothetical protein
MTRVRSSLIAALALLLLALPGAAAAKSTDRDRDRMPDRWERKHKLSVKKDDARLDADRDGLRNLAEYRAKTNPRKADSDRDGVLDGDEDRDRDKVDNANEDRERTSPGRKDSDRDGVRDGAEDADDDGLDNSGEDVTGNDPIDADSDDDGVSDGDEEAGVVESFEDGVLVVRLAAGGSISGRVTAGTEVECETEDEHEWWDDDMPAGEDPKTPAGEDAPKTPPTGDAGDDDSRNTLDVIGRERRGNDEDNGGPGNAEDRDEDSGDDEDSEDDWDDSEDDWDDSEWDDEDCGVEALVPGAVVHEAKLVLGGDGAVFLKIELVE